MSSTSSSDTTTLPDLKNIVENALHAARLKKSLTQEEVAARARITVAHLHAIETGNVEEEVYYTSVVRIASVMGYRLSVSFEPLEASSHIRS